MPTGEFTDADRDLCRDLAKAGVTVKPRPNAKPAPVNPRHLQTWRRLGLMAGPVVVRRGREGTSSERYPPEAFDQAREVADLLSQAGNLHIVVLGLFGAGRRNPTERALKKALEWQLNLYISKGVQIEATIGTPAFSDSVRRFAASLGRDVPELLAGWNAHAKQEAGERRQHEETVRGEPGTDTSKTVREEEAEELIVGLLDPVRGDPVPFLESMGMSLELVDGVAELGLPSWHDCLEILDGVSFEELVLLRDLVRQGWQEQAVALMPGALQRKLKASFDDPLVFGIMVPVSLLPGIFCHRRGLALGLDEEASPGIA